MSVTPAPVVRRLRANLASIYLVYALAFLSGAIVTPVVFNALGKEAYGVWAFIGSLTIYLGLLDLGVGPSVVRFTAAIRGRGAGGETNALASAGLVLYVALGSVAVAVGAVLVVLLPSLIDMPPDLVRSARIAFALVVAGLALRLPLGLFTNLLLGRQRSDLANAGNGASIALYITLALAILTQTGGIVTLAVISLAATLVRLLVPVLLLRVELPDLTIRRSFVTRRKVRELLGFSVHNFLINVSAKIVFSTDVIVVGAVLGSGAAGTYAIPAGLFGIVNGLASAGPGLLYPAFAELHGSGDEVRQARLLARGLRGAVALMALLALPLVFIPEYLIRSWLGESLAGSAAVASLLGCVLLVHQVGFVLAQLLMARGAQRALSLVLTVSVAVNLAASIVLAQTVGLWGVALATLVTEIAASFVAIPVLVRRETTVSLAGLARAVLRPLVPALLVGAPVLLGLAHLLHPHSLPVLAVVGAAWIAVWAVVTWLVGLDAGDRADTRRRLLSRPTRAGAAAAVE
jgi:O-antigen/teichoic acid export membrane protein